MQVEHSAIRVSDLDASRRFYVDGLGLSVQRSFEDEGREDLFVGTDQGGLLQLRYDPDGGPVEHADGFDHVAMRVEDVDEAFERLVASTDCPVHREPADGHRARIAFVEDPDGYRVELVEH